MDASAVKLRENAKSHQRPRGLRRRAFSFSLFFRIDVALLKIPADNLPALTLADSDKVEVGDVVLAVVNPFGVGQTVTVGIVSAKDRVTSGNMDEGFIQIRRADVPQHDLRRPN